MNPTAMQSSSIRPLEPTTRVRPWKAASAVNASHIKAIAAEGIPEGTTIAPIAAAAAIG